MRRLSAKNQALSDQIVAILRDADGFPVSTGEIASKCGQRLVSWGGGRLARPRPACWPEDTQDDGLNSRAFCERCNGYHHEPVWRTYDAQDVRNLLNRMAKAGEIEKLVMDGYRTHYWRREDTDSG